MSSKTVGIMDKRRARATLALIGAAIGVVLLAHGRPAHAAPASPGSTNVSLVAYSTPREAYAELIPAFQQTPEGKDSSFTQSYGASGEQSRAVQNGLKADIVA